MSDHDDGDWDSEVGEGLLDIVGDMGGVWFPFILCIIGLGLLAWHLWG